MGMIEIWCVISLLGKKKHQPGRGSYDPTPLAWCADTPTLARCALPGGFSCFPPFKIPLFIGKIVVYHLVCPLFKGLLGGLTSWGTILRVPAFSL